MTIPAEATEMGETVAQRYRSDVCAFVGAQKLLANRAQPRLSQEPVARRIPPLAEPLLHRPHADTQRDKRRGVMLPLGWLFPGRNFLEPIPTHQPSRLCLHLPK